MQIPDGIIVSDVTITQNIPVYKSVSSSEKVRVRDRGIHYLTGKMKLTSEDPRLIEGFLLGLRNSVNTFEIDLGNRAKPKALTSKQIKVSYAGATTGSTRIPVLSFGGSVTTGDMLKLLNATKLYYVTGFHIDSQPGGGTQPFILIYPPLRTDLKHNDILDFDRPKVTARLDDSTQTVTYNEQGLIGEVTISWREVT